MYSEKLESIPKSKSQALKTYLSEIRSSEGYVKRRTAASQSGLDESTVQVILSELVESEILQAKVQIRCPYCSTQHGIYSRRSNVPNQKKTCFSCRNDFQMSERRNWEVIYEITGNPGGFFQENNFHIKKFAESGRDLPPSFFLRELKKFREFESVDTPQQRGREFDYLMGLLFHQLPGVDIRLKQQGKSGEVDVHMIYIDADACVHRLVGSQTVIENKWEKDPIQKNEIIDFYEKASELTSCEMAYFVSMSGFSRGDRKETGSLAKLRNYRDPQIIDLWEDDVERMLEEGSPEEMLRERMME